MLYLYFKKCIYEISMQIKGNDIKKQPEKNNPAQLEVTEPTELMKFLIEKMPGKSRNNIKSLMANNQIILNNKAVKQFDYPLQSGQVLTINPHRPPKDINMKGIKLLYEDDYIIVIKKEAGLLSIATEKNDELTAYSQLSEYVKIENPVNKIFVLHRLDRETSGVMMFAKNQEVKQLLQSDWQESVMERCYVVIVEGYVEQESGTITSWLTENKNYLVFSSSIDNGGQKAVTHYKVLKTSKKYSMVEIHLETGRKNQIRVHMQDIGHSVIGDKKYGAVRSPINRLGLHAYILAFKHPITGEILRFETDIPKEFLNMFQ
jgi:23S rRNA pseudouridine1911/1915/1917 synthase